MEQDRECSGGEGGREYKAAMIISGDTKIFIADSDQDQPQTPGTTQYLFKIWANIADLTLSL